MKPKLIKLSELFELTSGGTPSRKNDAYYKNGNIPWIKTGDLKNMHLSNSSEFITELGLRESSAKLFPKGTVLIAMYGATIGNCSILSIDAASNQACAAFKPSEKILPEFLYYYLTSIKKRLISLGVGGAQPNISLSILKDIKIPLVSIDKQKKIVMILNRSQELINKRKAQIEALDQLTQSVFLEMFGDPINNPKEWEVKKLKNITNKILSGTTPKGGSQVYIEKGITFLRSQNVWKNRLVLDDVVYIDKETHNKMKKSSLKYGDILMTKTGRINTENSSLGRAAIFLGKNDSANINGHVYLIRLQKDIINEFILFILTTDEYREYIRRVCVGGIDKRQINKEHLEEFPIISPPIELQVQFSNLLTHVEKLKSGMRTSLNELEDNFNSLLQRAFKGELFTQKKLPNA
ncbi:restriction endonuclease subunit S [Priestia megaterium]|uniref:restriction endonuclease subunit S n=1 Tax=Priestia megaterium TaxID=1404 RepID=UPI001156347F|nr:restriction endonuclease subunit S [Priestia megaterium]